MDTILKHINQSTFSSKSLIKKESVAKSEMSSVTSFLHSVPNTRQHSALHGEKYHCTTLAPIGIEPIVKYNP